MSRVADGDTIYGYGYEERGPFFWDTLEVVWGILKTFGLYISVAGFETQDFYVLRQSNRLVVLEPGDVRPAPRKRLKPLHIRLPGWSRFTRMECIREREVYYFWF